MAWWLSHLYSEGFNPLWTLHCSPPRQYVPGFIPRRARWTRRWQVPRPRCRRRAARSWAAAARRRQGQVGTRAVRGRAGVAVVCRWDALVSDVARAACRLRSEPL